MDVAASARAVGVTVPTTMMDVIQDPGDILSHLGSLVGRNAVVIDTVDVQFAPAGPNPGKLICVGLNYRKHAVESNIPSRRQPFISASTTTAWRHAARTLFCR